MSITDALHKCWSMNFRRSLFRHWHSQCPSGNSSKKKGFLWTIIYRKGTKVPNSHV